MAKSVYNKDASVDFTKQPMFFGEDNAVQRFDTYKYPIFDKLNNHQLGLFWRPEEVSLQKDRNDWQELRPEQKHIFTSNLRYQTLLDSVQGRGPCLAFLPFCSLPELEGCILTWDFMESIHSRSYTYIIKNVYSQPGDVFDKILTDKYITERAEAVTKTYDELINDGQRWLLDGEVQGISTKELKRKLWRALVNVNILEGIRFYVSFACSFAFGELKLMEGSAKIISLIARDESQHLAVSQHIIKNYKNSENDKEMLEVIAEDTLIEPWQSEFVVETSKKVTVEVKSQKDKKPSVSVVKSRWPQKGVPEAISFCIEENYDYDLVYDDDYYRFLWKLSENQALAFYPLTPETCSRVTLECKMMNMKVFITKLVGASHEPWFEKHGVELINLMREKRNEIYDILVKISS